MRRRNKKSRVFAVALSAFLITTMLPSGVLAAEQVSAPETAITEAIAEAKAYAALTQEIGKVSVYAQVYGESVDAEEEDITSTEGESASEQDTVGGSAEDTEGGTAGDSGAETDTIGGSAEDTSGATDGGSDADETQEVSEAADESASGENELETGNTSSSAKMSSAEAEEEETAAVAEDSSEESYDAVLPDDVSDFKGVTESNKVESATYVCTVSYSSTNDETSTTYYYTSVADAVTDISSLSNPTGTITMTADSKEASPINIGSASNTSVTVTLNLAGYTLTGGAADSSDSTSTSTTNSVIIVYGSLTVTDEPASETTTTTGTITGGSGTIDTTDTESSDDDSSDTDSDTSTDTDDETASESSDETTDANRYGGGIYVAKDGTLTMTGGTITGNSADYGGGICVEEGATCTLSDDVVITSNTADDGGGGLYVKYDSNYSTSGNTTVSVSGIEISSNTANYGGGIYANYAITDGLKISDCTIKNNVATTGGGGIYYNSSYNTLPNSSGSSSGSTISGNYAAAGGGIYSNGSQVTINSGTISGNYATDAKNNKASESLCGGGIYVSGGSMSISGGTISGNYAQAAYTGTTLSTLYSNGGGIYVSSGALSVSGGSITGNYAKAGSVDESTSTSDNGGGIYVNSGTFTMSDGTISSNEATDDGGGIYITDYTSSDDTIYGATAKITGGTIGGSSSDANTATNGGGIYITGTQTTTTTGDTTTTTYNSSLTISNDENSSPTISYNTASSSDYGGGGIASDGGSVTVSGGTISNNTASEKNGGGIIAYNGASVTITGDAAITSNTASNNGGGIYITDKKTSLTISGGTIGGTSSSAKNSAKKGAGVCVDNGTFSMSGGAISANTASQNGGGIYISSDLQEGSTITGGTIGGSTTTTTNGETTTTGTGNTAELGGGIYISGNSALTMSGGEISYNEATYTGGGGVYVAASDSASAAFTMSGGTIKENSATNGGGIYLAGTSTETTSEDETTTTTYTATFTMSDDTSDSTSGGTISSNTASNYGGGVYVANSYSVFTMSAGTIDSCTSSSDGGGVYVNGGTFNMSGGTISESTAGTVETGTMYTYSGLNDSYEYTIDDSYSYIKKGTGSGGGVYVGSSGTFTMSGGTIGGCTTTETDGETTPTGTGNRAAMGGGVYVTGSSTFTMTDGTISYNTGYGYGGGVCIDGGGSSFTMGSSTSDGSESSSAEITNNTVYNSTNSSSNNTNDTAYGGGVYVVGTESDDSVTYATFTMYRGSITCNTAKITIPIWGKTSSSVDTPGGYGGGICLGDYTTAVIGRASTDETSGASARTISNNSASHRGGGICANGEGSTFTMSYATVSNNNTTAEDASKYILDYYTAESKDSHTEISKGETPFKFFNGEGGGIYLLDLSSMSIANSTISYNSTDYYGGGIYIKSVGKKGSTTNSKITDCTVNYNSASNDGTMKIYFSDDGETFDDRSAPWGGGLILNDSSGATLVISGDSEFNYNYTYSSVGSRGSGICNKGTMTITGTSTTYIDIQNNNYNKLDGASNDAVWETHDCQGGGVYNGGTLTMSYCNVKYNQARTAGGIMNNGAGSTITVSNSNVSSNAATLKGGGLDNQYGSMTLTSTEVSSNKAPQGGGICNQSNQSSASTSYGYLVLNGATVKNNTATSYGGGILAREKAGYIVIQSYTSDDSTTTGSTITGNTAPYGGGIYDAYDGTGSTYIITSSSITSNTASSDGGGMYLYGAAVTLNGASIQSNTATSGNGGGVYAAGSTKITQSTADGASASYIGGTTTTTTTDEDENETTTTTAAGNSAVNGGGVYASAVYSQAGTTSYYNAVVTISGIEISNNTASTNGGAIYACSAVETKTTTSTDSGGNETSTTAYTEYSSTLNIYDCDVQHNTAIQGGGVYMTGTTFNTSNSTDTETTYSGVLANNTATAESTSSISAQAADLYADDSSSVNVAGISNTTTYYEADGLGNKITGWYWDKADDKTAETERYATMTDKDEAKKNEDGTFESDSTASATASAAAEADETTSSGTEYILIAAYEPDADDDVVIDYGLPVDIDFMDNDINGDSEYLKNIADSSYQLTITIRTSETDSSGSTIYSGVCTVEQDENDNTKYSYSFASNSSTSTYTTSYTGSHGKLGISYYTSGTTNLPYVTYELTETLEEKETFTYVVTTKQDTDGDDDYSNEDITQAYEGSITIMPATSMYYEEDFGSTVKESSSATGHSLIQYVYTSTSTSSDDGTDDANSEGSSSDTVTTSDDSSSNTTSSTGWNTVYQTSSTDSNGTTTWTDSTLNGLSGVTSNLDTSSLSSYTQEGELVGTTTDSVYGSDTEYLSNLYDSELHSAKAEVSSGAAAFRYYFTGTGTTIYARTSENSAYIGVTLTYEGDSKVYYTNTSGTEVELSSSNKTADTWYIDTRNVADTSNTTGSAMYDKSGDGTLYNIPVFDVTDLPYGKWKVYVYVYAEGTEVDYVYENTTVYSTDYYIKWATYDDNGNFKEYVYKQVYTDKNSLYYISETDSNGNATSWGLITSTSGFFEKSGDSGSEVYTKDTSVTKSSITSASYSSTEVSAYVPVEGSNESGKEFYLDGVRVYDPAGSQATEKNALGYINYDIYSAYTSDGENDPVLLNISDAVSSTSGSFATLTDIDGSITKTSDYTSYGPNNELYLYNSDSSNSSDPTTISFYMLYWSDDYKIYLGMKSPNGTAATVTVGNTSGTKGTNYEEYPLSNSVDCYYDITDYLTSVTLQDSSSNTVSGKKVTVTVSSGLASLTYIKVIGASTYTIDSSGTYEEVTSGNEDSTPQTSATLTFASIDTSSVSAEENETDTDTSNTEEDSADSSTSGGDSTDGSDADTTEEGDADSGQTADDTEDILNDDGSSDTGSASSASSAAKKQTIKVKQTSLKKTISCKKLKKKKQTFKIKATAKGKLTYTKISGNKKITVSKKGKVTIKKGLKKGTYKVKIKIKAAKTKKYKKATVTKTLKIKVK